MIKIDKLLIIKISFILFSLLIALSNTRSLIIDEKFIFGNVITLTGIGLALYTFIISPLLSSIEKKKLKNSQDLDNFFKDYEDNLFFNFKILLVLLIINFIKCTNIPFIIDPKNIDFGIFYINSLKDFIIDFFVSLSLFLSLFSFYDLFISTFMIREILFDISE